MRLGVMMSKTAKSGEYKIGMTKDPYNRLKTFGVQLPFQVEYELVIESNDYKAFQKELHARFQDKHINGEWFALDQADVEALREEYRQQIVDI